MKSRFIQETLLLNNSNNQLFMPAILLAIIFLIPVKDYAQSDEINLFDIESRKNFGDYLFCEKDFLRANAEFRSVLGERNNDTIRFKIGYALQEMGKHDEAIDNFKSLFFSSELENPARLAFYKSQFLKRDFSQFRLLAEKEPYINDDIHVPLEKLSQVSYLIENILPDSIRYLNAFKAEERDQMLKFYLMKKYPGYKNESTAALLSAVIPGLGKLYADEIGDGITSFLLTGVLGFLAYNNFENNHSTRAWIFTGLAAYFYAGNIYGSMAAVQNFNAGLKFNFDSELEVFLQSKDYFIPDPDFICR